MAELGPRFGTMDLTNDVEPVTTRRGRPQTPPHTTASSSGQPVTT